MFEDVVLVNEIYVTLFFTAGRTGVPFVDANMRELLETG